MSQVADIIESVLGFTNGWVVSPERYRALAEYAADKIAALKPDPTPKFKDGGDRFAQRTMVLAALKNAGSRGCQNTELTLICLRYGGRIHELRRMGYKIKTERLKPGLYLYTLQG